MFSDEEIKILAECERKMDANQVEWVVNGNSRIMLISGTLAHFGLAQGQTINNTIFEAILIRNIEICKQQIAAETDKILEAEEIG